METKVRNNVDKNTGRKIDALLKQAIASSASDLHLKAGKPPILRINGELKFSELEVVTQFDIETYIQNLSSESQQENLKNLRNIDLSYSIPGVAQFRVNIFRQAQGVNIAARIIPVEIPSIEELFLPPILKKLSERPSGLVLITGPTGAGKTTTLASLVNYINQTRRGHIITIEDPIEFVHSDKLSVITQQEIGRHTSSFASGLKSALRGDPDVIVVGEMRDLETISNALTAAETGHLVFGTLHTNDAIQAIDRLIDVFPPHGQHQIRTQLASVLQGVVYQTLIMKKDGAGRRAAFEVLIANQAIRNLIKENKTYQISNILQTSKEEGMQLLNDSLKALYNEGIIDAEEAISKSFDPLALEKTLLKSQMKSFQLSPGRI